MKLHEKVCPECKKLFRTIRVRQVSCSISCATSYANKKKPRQKRAGKCKQCHIYTDREIRIKNRSKLSSFCSNPCMLKWLKENEPAKYKRINELHRQQRKKSTTERGARKFITKIRAGRLIKAEVLETPIEVVKGLWNGAGNWSRHYQCCEECNTTVYVYQCRGLCRKCYSSLVYQALSKEDKIIRKIKARNSNHLMRSRREDYMEYIEKAQKGEVVVTAKIQNVLRNLEETLEEISQTK